MATNSLQDFISRAKQGIAHTNRFTIQFGLPNLVQKDMFDLRALFLFCENVTMPSINIATVPSRTFGEQREIPYDRNFESITATFYVDKGMKVKSFFDSWVNSIIDPRSRTINYYDDYTTNMQISVLDMQENTVHIVELYEVYPKSIGQISLDNNAKDLMRLNVSFAYKHHISASFDVNSGEPNMVDTFRINKLDTEFNGMIPTNYYNAGNVFASGVPSEYTNNFRSYQEQYVDSQAAINALTRLNRQGIQTGNYGVTF